MAYRSSEAQEIHDWVLSYIREPDSKKLEKLDQLYLTEESVVELSIHDHSHLIDILHLTFAIIADNQAQASKVCFELLTKFFVRLKALSLHVALAKLLLQKDKEGFTPLHHALQAGQVENMRLYFEEVRRAVEAKHINAAQYRDLLIQSNQAGFTPLHEALMAGQVENMRLYFEEVRRAVEAKHINAAQYQDLLIQPNQAGFTPLHEALMAGQVENMRLYFEEVRRAVEAKHISAAQYQDLLIQPNQAGFTPLHEALMAGQVENMQLYLEEVRRAVEAKHISAAQYRDLLIQSNQAGFTPLHQALKAGQVENMRLYLEEVHRAVEAKHINAAQYRDLLIQSNQAGFTPLHDALRAGQVENMQLYFEEVRRAVDAKHISAAQYRDLLIQSNQAGFTPLHQALKAGQVENMRLYLEEVHRAVEAKHINAAQYRDLLIKPNQAGFTPLHEALMAGQVENMRLYFEEVRRAVEAKHISAAQYRDLLIQPNQAGYTPLHQAANSGSFQMLKEFLIILDESLPEEILAPLQQTEKFHVSRYPEISRLLEDKRRQLSRLSPAEIIIPKQKAAAAPVKVEIAKEVRKPSFEKTTVLINEKIPLDFDYAEDLSIYKKKSASEKKRWLMLKLTQLKEDVYKVKTAVDLEKLLTFLSEVLDARVLSLCDGEEHQKIDAMVEIITTKTQVSNKKESGELEEMVNQIQLRLGLLQQSVAEKPIAIKVKAESSGVRRKVRPRNGSAKLAHLITGQSAIIHQAATSETRQLTLQKVKEEQYLTLKTALKIGGVISAAALCIYFLPGLLGEATDIVANKTLPTL